VPPLKESQEAHAVRDIPTYREPQATQASNQQCCPASQAYTLLQVCTAMGRVSWPAATVQVCVLAAGPPCRPSPQVHMGATTTPPTPATTQHTKREHQQADRQWTADKALVVWGQGWGSWVAWCGLWWRAKAIRVATAEPGWLQAAPSTPFPPPTPPKSLRRPWPRPRAPHNRWIQPQQHRRRHRSTWIQRCSGSQRTGSHRWEQYGGHKRGHEHGAGAALAPPQQV
jgi:hypothetical protein